MESPQPATELLVDRLWQLLQGHKQNWDLFDFREHPYQPVLPVGEGVARRGTPHLLMNRSSVSKTYVLISESKRALFLDFGYDFHLGFPAGSDRASRRPWLYTLPALKTQFGVESIDVVLSTHYHDDHVAGCNLLRDVEGTQVWAAQNFADILEHPDRYDLPCLWYDPIPVDRYLPLEKPIRWEEYTLTLHPLPGHTRHAVAVELEVDGLRFLATGDQYHGSDGLGWNYVYQSGFAIGDYTAGAKLYQRICPDFILSGHWQPLRVTPEYFARIASDAETLDRLHRELLPESPNLGAEDRIAEILPYQVTVSEGETVSFEVKLHSPFPQPEQAHIQVVAPQGWTVERGTQTLPLSGVYWLLFTVTAPQAAVRRARLSIDVTIGGQRFGQQAEALVTVLPAVARSSNETLSWFHDTSFFWENSVSDFETGDSTSLPLP